MGKKVMNCGYDLSSSPVHRVLRHYLLSRLIPMGVYRGGAGLKCLLVVLVIHSLGRPIFWFITRFERHVARMYRLKEKFHQGT